MICSKCGTDIAGKALVCYRCGAATAEPSGRTQTARRGGRGRIPTALGLIVLVVAGLYMSRAATVGIPPIAALLVVLLGIVAVVAILAGRRRD